MFLFLFFCFFWSSFGLTKPDSYILLNIVSIEFSFSSVGTVKKGCARFFLTNRSNHNPIATKFIRPFAILHWSYNAPVKNVSKRISSSNLAKNYLSLLQGLHAITSNNWCYLCIVIIFFIPWAFVHLQLKYFQLLNTFP